MFVRVHLRSSAVKICSIVIHNLRHMKIDSLDQIEWKGEIHWQELEQMRDFAALPLWEKLGWLEEAQRFVEFQKQRQKIRQQEKHD